MPTEYSTPEQADPLIGTTIVDRYRILRKLGEGGMGVVYEAEHTLLRRRVAIKTLHAQFARNGLVVARFQREAMAATSIGNEHIIDATDMGHLPDGAIFLVLEFLQGQELGKLIERQGALPVGRAVRIVMQMCEALQAAHDKGIVHRDLKPDNVFLINRGENPDFVKVLDFGISKFRDADSESGGMTKTGAVMGTPYYMSPEQAQGLKGVDHRTDVYAIGVILFQMLSGTLPFVETNFPMLVVSILTKEAPDLRSLRTDLPDELVAIVARMLAKAPAERPGSCAELRTQLSPFASIDTPPPLPRPAAYGAPSLGTDSFVNSATDAIDPLVPPSRSGAIAVSRNTVSSITVPAAPATSAPPEPKSRRAIAIGIGAAVVLGSGSVILLTRMSGSVAPRGAAPSPAEASLPAPIARPTPAAVAQLTPLAPAPLAVAPTIHLRIGTTPPGGELILDRRPISNPFDGELPVDSAIHRVEARMVGHRTVVQEVSLDYSQSITIPLARGSGVENHAMAAHGRPPSTPEPAAMQPPTIAPSESPRAVPAGAAAQTTVAAPTPGPTQPTEAPTVARHGGAPAQHAEPTAAHAEQPVSPPPHSADPPATVAGPPPPQQVRSPFE